jgi:putative DNA primase/helicase
VSSATGHLCPAPRAPPSKCGRDEAKLKTLTGGDKITARFMRMDYFDFTPTFKLFIAGNHKPRLGTVDEAMQRRLLLPPFTVQIPKAERDTDLPRKLEAEWPAILRWAIDGCLEWQRIGLAPPKSVCAATAAYFEEQDTVGEWLEDYTVDGGAFAFTPFTDLFSSWKGFCEAHNLKAGSAMALSGALSDRNYVKTRDPRTGQRGFAGLTLKSRQP